MNNNGIYDGDQNPKSDDTDKLVDDGFIEMPRNIHSSTRPSGWPFAVPDTARSTRASRSPGVDGFDKIKNGQNPKAREATSSLRVHETSPS